MPTATASVLTAAEITDARLNVIAAARETLLRARSECGAWRGGQDKLRDTYIALLALEDALARIGSDKDEAAKDRTVELCAQWTRALVTAVRDDMGDEAATYVSSGELGDEDAA
jgi:hypothetical protein